jgi:zinc protease
MKFAALVFPVLTFSASLAGAADLPSGESLLERCLVKSGGAEAYAKVKSATMTGTVEIVGRNIAGPVSVFQQGDKTYTVIELPGIGKVEEGFDGITAWETNALQGPRIKDGEEKAATVRASRLNPMGSWREYYKDARTVGEEDVEGKPAWKVELTPKEGKPETFFFDKDSAMLVRMTQTVSSAMGEIPVDVSLTDYRSVGGIRTPFTMTQKAMSQVMAMHFEKVEWNPVLPASRFDPPAAVQALIAKRK